MIEYEIRYIMTKLGNHEPTMPQYNVTFATTEKLQLTVRRR